MDRSKQLGEERVGKLLLKFSIPAIVGMVVNALYNIVDRIFIGNAIGRLGIAGITVVFPFATVIMAFCMLIGIGSNSLISIKLGEGKKEEADRIAANGMVLLIITSLLLSIIGLIFIDPLLRLFGASEEVLPYARDYMRIILYGAVFQCVGLGMNNYIRGEANPRIAMYTMLIGAIINTILDPIFIFVFGWGIKGAAFATIISMIVSAVWVLYYFFSGKSLIKIHAANLKLRFKVVMNIFVMGSAPFAIQMVASLLNIVLNNSLRHYSGDIAVSAMGVVNSISMLMLMPIFGINQGVQPIIGYNYGAEKFDRVKEALKLAIIFATSIVTIGFIIVQLFPIQLIKLFNKNDTELILLGARALRIYMILLPIIGFQIVGANYFQAVGKPKKAIFLSLSRQLIILIPAIIILPRLFGLGLNGVFIAGPLSDFISCILTATLLFAELKHLDQKHCTSYNEA